KASPDPVAPPAPKKKKRKKKQAAPKPASKSSEPPKVTATAPRVMPATGAPSRTAARPVVVKQSSGTFGFLFAIVLACLVGAIVYVMMEKQNNARALAAASAKNKPPETVVVKAPPRPRPVTPVEPEPEPEPEGFPVFAKVLKPILEAKCVSCHGAEKMKGRLAMHTIEKLQAGSGNGSILEPDADDPTRIEMIFRAELPASDDEHMPPQGEPQLTADELAILKWWIKAGAHEDIESSEAPDEVRKKLQALAQL
ncbi:MAG: hypothetical protein ACI8XO_004921, partial [Verrucomicrobiales bacterium]